jgi:hypothetical protein
MHVRLGSVDEATVDGSRWRGDEVEAGAGNDFDVVIEPG